MSYIAYGLKAYTVAEQDEAKKAKVQLPREPKGWALLEMRDGDEAWHKSNGDIGYKVLYGEFEIERFHSGRVAAMSILTLANSQIQKAVRVLTNTERWGERFVYVNGTGEYVANAIYVWAGKGLIAKDKDGYNKVNSLTPTALPNPESVDGLGFVKSWGISLQRQLIEGVKFNCDMTNPYEYGLHTMGKAATMYATKEEKRISNHQLFLFVTTNFLGYPMIGNIHALQLLGHLELGGKATVMTPDFSGTPQMGAVHAYSIWRYCCEQQLDYVKAGQVEIVLD